MAASRAPSKYFARSGVLVLAGDGGSSGGDSGSSGGGGSPSDATVPSGNSGSFLVVKVPTALQALWVSAISSLL